MKLNASKPGTFFVMAVLISAASLLSPKFSDAAVTKTEMIPMRDGVRLATEILLPDESGKKRPAVLIRTPYGRDMIAKLAGPLLGMGNDFVWVIQDTRGRFDSEGRSSSFIDDAFDGYETIEWLAAQPWSNGKIGTGGISAMGITQYVMHKTRPPHLTCQHVMAASPNLYEDAAYQGGGVRRALMIGWLAGNNFPTYVLELMFSNVDYGGLWELTDLFPDVHKVNVPIMHMAGWYDMFLKGNLDAFTAIQEKGDDGARGKQRLVIGPWTHGGFAGLAGLKQGELTYPGNSRYDIFTKITKWFDECLNGRSHGFMKGPAVRYYVMGDPEDESAPGNEWREADSWPVPAEITPYYFHKDGTLSAAKPALSDASLSLVDDPASPVPTIGGANLILPAGPYDQRPVEKREDVLVFSTPVLEEPLEITGPIESVIYFTTDVVDTDFTVRLTDVYPDGRSMLLTDGIARASHMEGRDHRIHLEPGKTYKIAVDLWATSIIINKGHRIRVSVSGTNFPRFDVNMHNGRYFDLQPGEIDRAIETGLKEYAGKPDLADDAKAANVTVHLDAEKGSHILLPVVK
ncbi:MAG: CocE/NonD family hydrolase [bacterium]